MQNDRDTNPDTNIDFSAAMDRLDTLNAQIRQHETRVRALALYSRMTPIAGAVTGASCANTLFVYNAAKDAETETPAVPAFGGMTLVLAFAAVALFVKQQKTRALVKNGEAAYQSNMKEKADMLDLPVEIFKPKPIVPRR